MSDASTADPELEIELDPADNALTALLARGRADDPCPVFIERRDDGNHEMTAGDVIARVDAIAAGLVGAGIQPGERVAIFSHGSIDWSLVDYAIWRAGAVSVTVYESSSPEQVEWILTNSGAVAILVEDDARADAVSQVRPGTPSLRHLFAMTEAGLDGLVRLGEGVEPSALDERTATITHDAPATLVYTSGTTGRSKGVVLSHRNLIWTIRQTIRTEPGLVGPDNLTLSFLPLAHILARVVQLTAVAGGVPVAYGGGVPTLQADMAALQPTWLTVVPRVLEKVHDGALHAAGHGLKRKIFGLAERVAIGTASHEAAAEPIPLRMRILHPLCERLVYRTMREALGGRLRYVISGGAPLHADLARFYNGIGVEVLEGYGLTETTGPASVHRVGRSKPGTVGPPLPGIDVRIGDTGEIMLTGPSVFHGYWDNAEATAESLTDRWFHTGDVGEIDGDGHICITGRIKDLIVTAGGKNVAPSLLEKGVEAHPLVEHCVVIGDNQRFIAALLVLDLDGLRAWAKDHDKPITEPERLVDALRDDPDLRAELQRSVDESNEQVSRAEGIRAFRVLSDQFGIESGELTPTLKVKRAVVIDRNAAVIEEIYAAPS